MALRSAFNPIKRQTRNTICTGTLTHRIATTTTSSTSSSWPSLYHQPHRCIVFKPSALKGLAAESQNTTTTTTTTETTRSTDKTHSSPASSSPSSSPPSSSSSSSSLPLFCLPPYSPAVSSLLHGYSDFYPVTVAWGEMDSFLHINNANYIRYIESARIYAIRSLQNLPLPKKNQSDIHDAMTKFMGTTAVGPILKSVYYDYKSPVVYPDTLLVGSRLHSISRDRYSMTHRLVSVKQEKIVGEAEGVIVTFNYNTNTKSDIPAVIRHLLEAKMKLQHEADMAAPHFKPPRTTQNFAHHTHSHSHSHS